MSAVSLFGVRWITQEFGEGHFENGGETFHDVDGDVEDAAFGSSDSVDVQAGEGGELGLTEAACFSGAAEVGGEEVSCCEEPLGHERQPAQAIGEVVYTL